MAKNVEDLQKSTDLNALLEEMNMAKLVCGNMINVSDEQSELFNEHKDRLSPVGSRLKSDK